MRYHFEIEHVSKRARLPHWDVPGGMVFATFNLHDAIPAATRKRLLDEVETQISVIEKTRGDMTHAEREAISQWLRDRLSETLDEGHGACFMKDRRIAAVVADALTFFDDQRYRLHAWCVMPNHIHVVFELAASFTIASVMHSWKGYTAKTINKFVGRSGTLWHEEYFDRTMRSSEHLQHTIDYVLNNPMKAELFEWPFVKSYPVRIAAALP